VINAENVASVAARGLTTVTSEPPPGLVINKSRGPRLLTVSIIDQGTTRRRRPLMIAIDSESKINVVRSRAVSTSATTASEIAKIMTPTPAIVTACGNSSALPKTMSTAANTAATALIASERTGGGAVSVNRASGGRESPESLTGALYRSSGERWSWNLGRDELLVTRGAPRAGKFTLGASSSWGFRREFRVEGLRGVKFSAN
jgi:hypothetical protein